MRARASASPQGATGSLGGSSVCGLTVLGEAVAATPNARVLLGDWGYLVVLEQAVVGSGSSQHGRRVFVSGLHVHLTADHGGLPAGSDITVGYARRPRRLRSRRRPRPSRIPIRPQVVETAPASGGGNGNGGSDGSGPKTPPRDPQPQPPGANPTPPPIVQDPPADVRPNLTRGGYVFPVYGPASFGDDFSAARADHGLAPRK